MTDLKTEWLEIAALPSATTHEEVCALRPKREAILNRIKENPALLTIEILDIMADIAGRSPWRDIDDPNAEIPHQQTPAQDVCFETQRMMLTLARIVPEMGKPIVERVEALIQDSLDWDIRKQGVMDLWILAIGKNEGVKWLAVEALERQGEENSDKYIRFAARDQLLQTVQYKPDVLPRAIAALAKGTDDPAPEARTRALALLTNHVKSDKCSYDEAESLMQIFEKAAAIECGQDGGAQYWAARGVTDVQEARRLDAAKQVLETGTEVKPLKPLVLKKP
jgi:hypothetical protein